MKPTNDELIRDIKDMPLASSGERKLRICLLHRLLGRLDVYEDYLSKVDTTNSARMREEIFKISEALGDVKK